MSIGIELEYARLVVEDYGRRVTLAQMVARMAGAAAERRPEAAKLYNALGRCAAEEIPGLLAKEQRALDVLAEVIKSS